MCFFRLVPSLGTIIYYFSNKEKAQQQKTKQNKTTNQQELNDYKHLGIIKTTVQLVYLIN